MDGMTLKEKAIVAVMVVVFMYAAAVALWFVRQDDEWTKSRREYATARAKYENECALIARKASLYEDYENEKTRMPTFAAGKATETVWLQKMGETAERNYIQIAARNSGKEIVAGDVTELPVTGKSWEGSLESLVKFLYDLETSTDGMFDVSTISISPSKGGFLTGSFTLTCAYMREPEK